MNITILKADKSNLPDIEQIESSFTVEAKLRLEAEDEVIRYKVVPISPYEKHYRHEVAVYEAYAQHADSAIYLAYRDEQVTGQKVAGRVVVKVNWNRFGWVEEIAVNKPYRKLGVGYTLMQQAVTWAKERHLAGLMLETQNNNVPACRFYERFGFKLKGFDTEVYKALTPDTDEVALYWYLVF